jgi:hypothetical protein
LGLRRENFWNESMKVEEFSYLNLIDGCWMFLDVFGCFWMFLDLSDPLGSLWMFLDVIGSFWILLEIFGDL